jgi:hypothetical protein
MGQYWHVYQPELNLDFATAVPDLEAALALKGQRVSGGDQSAVHVDVVDISGRRYFVKKYQVTRPGASDLVAKSKARREWDNLLFFRKLDIPTPLPVAIGESREKGAFREGVLVTAEVEHAMDLEALADSGNPCLHDPGWFRQLCYGLAIPLRRLHDLGFTHNDLNWRNILLTLEPQLVVYFFDCPAGRSWTWPFLSFRIIKDLTHLDKMGHRHLRRSERLRFYLIYSGHERLNKQDKKILRRVLQRDRD